MCQSSSAHLTTQKKQDPIAFAFRFLEQYRSPKDIHENGPIVGTVDTLWRENASWLSQHNCLSPSDILLCPLWDMVCGSIFVWSFYRQALTCVALPPKRRCSPTMAFLSEREALFHIPVRPLS